MMRVSKSKLAQFSVLVVSFALLIPGLASAHVIVSPSEALTGAYQTFTMSVPNEKDVPVTAVRLMIPSSLESVTPTVKPGWQIETRKSGDTVTEISWTSGTIDVGLRDEFTFSAHLPSKAGDIDWKAYQTYQDGSVVAWDQKPTEEQGHDSEDESKGPYSVTTVSDDPVASEDRQDSASNTVLYVLAVAALALSIIALIRTARK